MRGQKPVAAGFDRASGAIGIPNVRGVEGGLRFRTRGGSGAGHGRGSGLRKYSPRSAAYGPLSGPGRSLSLVYEGVVQDLIDELGQLPGIGPKGAQRIAFHLLTADESDVQRLITALTEVKAKVKFCTVCGNVAQDTLCRICADPRRDPNALCVVEEPKDVVAIERTREFTGRYHVLGGAISPIDGIGPEQLRIAELMARLGSEDITEVILATDPNIEGEATAAYLARQLRPFGLRVTRLASGLPVGGDLEYADEVTLGRAFEGRRLIDA
jgi:recombination protein RecR